MATTKKKTTTVKYPQEVLAPVKEHLLSKLLGLEKRKKELADEDPYKKGLRLENGAAMDADAEEQVGHMRVSAVRQIMDRSIIQVRKALSRIKFGKYGVCERCGKMIDTDRLMIMPETTLCVECEKSREK